MPLNLRLDDYQLTKWQVIQSVFVSDYAIRHWNCAIEQKSWGHLSIALLEFMPLVGVVASIIERVVVFIFDKCTTKSPAFSPSYLKNRVQSIKNWQEKFCQNAKKTMESVNEGVITTSPIKINLSPAQKDLLKLLINKLMKEEIPSSVNMIATGNLYVFEVDCLPGLVFKINAPDSDWFENFQDRMEATSFANEIIERENLLLLHTPIQELIQLDLDNGEEIPVLVEQKYDIEPVFEKQRGMYDFCLRNAGTKEFIKEVFRQLIIFTIYTGWSDVKYDNMPLINDGTGVALIDLDITSNPINGLISSLSEGRNGILNYLTPELIDEFTPLLKKLLRPYQFNRLKLDQIRKIAENRFQILQQFPEYLKKQNIQDPFQKVNFHVGNQKLREIQDTINGYLQAIRIAHKGKVEFIESDRAVLLYARESSLALLKKLKRIYDYQTENQNLATIYC